MPVLLLGQHGEGRLGVLSAHVPGVQWALSHQRQRREGGRCWDWCTDASVSVGVCHPGTRRRWCCWLQVGGNSWAGGVHEVGGSVKTVAGVGGDSDHLEGTCQLQTCLLRRSLSGWRLTWGQDRITCSTWQYSCIPTCREVEMHSPDA